MTVDLTPLQMKAVQAAKARAATALSLYRPTAKQEEIIRVFERMDGFFEMMLGGGVRAGKSLLAAMIISSAIKNEPITFNDGTKHRVTPERWDGEPLKIWIVGFDWRHIGKTLHRLLFMPGQFKVAKENGKLRPLDPEKDPQRVRKGGPSLIQADVDVVGGEDGISWENKKDYQIAAFTFQNGTRVEFFPSTGAMPQGDPAHLIWIDEHIDSDRWYYELMSRLIDHRGKLIWTTWPDTEPSDALSGLEDRATQEAGTPDQTSFAFVLKGGDNPFTKSKDRDAMMAKMPADMALARDQGIMNKDRWRVYGQFSKSVHCAVGADPTKDDALARTIRAYNGIPANWTRYLILDPGTKSPAVLFVACPPPELGDFIVPYGELYLHYTWAEPLAKAVAAKAGIARNSEGQITDPGEQYEEFIADFHAHRQTPAGFDGTIGQNYEKYFEAAGLRCRRRGSRFSAGSDNPTVRILSVQGTMNLRDGRLPKLRIMIDRCPHLVRQLEGARWARLPNGEPSEEQNKYQPKDVQQTLEYFVSRGDCRYVVPAVTTAKQPTPRDAVMKDMRKIFGRSESTRPADTSVYLGAGAISETPFL